MAWPVESGHAIFCGCRDAVFGDGPYPVWSVFFKNRHNYMILKENILF
ncbi:hypothetical protein GbCGDNIH3_7104 [Granulibacter bethesdensis]|uniref:Uncharacterized protein n=1 Tax=Granulibacter bethesdensis TaxID=364410 RepID=A0AAN0VG44_9PROT|nr:hypothetical protein GbCGDNIH3_7104 [Granulibacter bethesdensis]AHJ66252.1 hypothetical protein GbCGDNIH4_7209 [Granulibacter bethesdensis CGDNIH4]APH59639.1 hypothetical protein GbCGDNIH7_7104 [Granulibacter bethesdensis]